MTTWNGSNRFHCTMKLTDSGPFTPAGMKIIYNFLRQKLVNDRLTDALIYESAQKRYRFAQCPWTRR
jgi:hypothetical protein